MDTKTLKLVLPVGEENRKKANEETIEHLQNTLDDGRRELRGLRKKLSATYIVIVILSIIMFSVGVVLLSVPVLAAFRGEISETQSLISAGFGIADLVVLFLSRPLDRMHQLMGDMGQLTLAVNSFQTQVGLRLLEMDITKRETMGNAAEKVNEAAKDSIKVIQEYFEAKESTGG